MIAPHLRFNVVYYIIFSMLNGMPLHLTYYAAILVRSRLRTGLTIWKMDVTGLAKEWDSIEEVRERVRNGHKLYDHPEEQKWCEPNRANCVANAAALKPVLMRLRDHSKHTLPYLEPLGVEVTAFYRKANSVLATDDKVLYKTAVETKKLAGFVKRRANPTRQEFTKDGWVYICNCRVIACF